LAPGHLSGDKKHAYALEVLSNILGEGPTSKLFQELVVNDKLAVRAGSYYQGAKHGPGKFTLYASPQQGVGMDILENKIKEILANILRDGINKKEVERAKKRMRDKAIYDRDSLTAGARALGEALAVGLSVEYVETWPDRIGTVTKQEVIAAAKAVFNINRSVTSLLLQKNNS
jgi:zinc protease